MKVRFERKDRDCSACKSCQRSPALKPLMRKEALKNNTQVRCTAVQKFGATCIELHCSQFDEII